MQRPKRWNIAATSAEAHELAACLKTSPLLAQILINRGIASADDCRAFLSPKLNQLHDPDEIPNLPRAAERIAKAIRDREKIVIYGDYDVDGITATAILWHAITLLGGQVDFYIPHRLEEGYGLNAEAIAQICDGGAKLIVSVDCGVTAIEEAMIACERGVDLIVTDHHEWKEATERRSDEATEGQPLLPECYTVVHPRLPAEREYPNGSLCGAGVAFKLAWGLGRVVMGGGRVGEEFKQFLIEATALAALGTIADVVPLKGENRALAHFGLGGLKQSRLTGIMALIESAGLSGQRLDSYHVGFLLAPRLNACGRMGHAREAVEMLTRADMARATEIALELEEHNRVRQQLERKTFDEALEQVEARGLASEDCRGMVLGSDQWHPGVIGIVASRLVNRFNRPTVMVALSNGHGQGSGRSISGFHLARALDACRDHLEGCGGHEMAAGLRLETSRFDAFREAFREYANSALTSEMLVPQLRVDAVAELRQITQALVSDLDRLGPFGTSNPRPLLCCRELEVIGTPRRVGKTGGHASMLVRQAGITMKAIAFNRGELAEQLRPQMRVDLVVEPQINQYNGQTSVEMEIKDVAVRE